MYAVVNHFFKIEKKAKKKHIDLSDQASSSVRDAGMEENLVIGVRSTEQAREFAALFTRILTAGFHEIPG